MMQSGGAILSANDIVIDQGKRAAAHSGSRRPPISDSMRRRFDIASTADLGIHIMDLAERLQLPGDLPENVPPLLESVRLPHLQR